VKVLVTFALEAEFAPWRSIREFRRGAWGRVDVYVAKIGGAQVGVVLTGVGPRQAARAASRSIGSERDSLEFCISSGLAGALRPEYQTGQVLAARNVFSEAPRSLAAERTLDSSPSLISLAAELGASPVACFYTADRVIFRVEEKRHLGRDADAVEMETFEILRAAAEGGIPAVAIRAVSDTVEEALPFDMNRIFDDRGQVSLPRVLGQLARHPQSLPGLLNLGRRSRRAAESLAKFLDRYVGLVAERTKNLDTQLTVTAAS
jgi:adenosylhomocysteine nucleosidase